MILIERYVILGWTWDTWSVVNSSMKTQTMERDEGRAKERR